MTTGWQLEGLFDTLGERVGYYAAGSGNNYWLAAYVPFQGREVAEYSTGTVFYFMHTNALGSAATEINAGGGAAGGLLFYPWGQVWGQWVPYDTHFAGMHAALQGSSLIDWTMYDAANRFYASNLGRWHSPDPVAGDITYPQSLNRYAYVTNNPTSLTDPAGLKGAMPCPMVDTVAPPGCGNGGGLDYGGYTVDGWFVPNGIGEDILAAGFGLQCIGNVCGGIDGNGRPFYSFASWAGIGYFTYSGPGSLFYSLAAAGAAGALADQEASAAELAADNIMREYGQPVYTLAGVYSYSDLQAGEPCDPVTGACPLSIDASAIPEAATTVGLAHDHPGIGYGAYEFSEVGPNADITNLSRAGYYGFLATQPPGRVLMFDPNRYNNWLTPGAPPPVCVLQAPTMGGTPCF